MFIVERVGQLVEMPLEQGGSILVEVDDVRSGPVTRGGRAEDMVTTAGESLEQVLGKLGPAVQGIVSKLREGTDWPDQVEVEFSVKLSAGANVIITRTEGEANFRIALRWSRAAT
jgi:hypothetical protein